MRVEAIQFFAVFGALGASMAGALWVDPPEGGGISAAVPSRLDGREFIEDARGQRIPIRSYRRIVSLNPMADHMLLRLVEPSRLVGITEHTRRHHPDGWRFGHRPTFATSTELEHIMAAKPDLVVVSKFADEAFMSRLREREVVVFDLGDMLGVKTAVTAIRSLAAALDVPSRGAELVHAFRRELLALQTQLEGVQPAPGIFVTMVGDSIFGGTRGSSFSDLLHYGGVRDLAAEAGYTGWPRLSPEQVLALDPPWVVTSAPKAALLCQHGALQKLRACERGRVVELSPNLHSDPGLGLVKAAQELQQKLHGITLSQELPQEGRP